MRVDVGRRLQFPEVVRTTLHPDIILWSTEDQKTILAELTVLWEEGCKEAHERKAMKYKGRQAWLFSCCQLWAWTKGARNKQIAGWRRQNKPLAGCGVGERREGGSQEQMGGDLATTAGPPAGECCG